MRTDYGEFITDGGSVIKRKYIISALFSVLFCVLFSQKNAPIIHEIIFQGNTYFSNRNLQSKLNLKESSIFHLNRRYDHTNKRLLRMDLMHIQRLYRENGFLEVTVNDSLSISDDNATVWIKICEGNQHFWGGINISGNHIFSEQEIASVLQIKNGKPVNIFRLRENLEQLSQLYKNAGKNNATFSDSLKLSDRVTLFLKIYEGKNFYFGKTEITGLKTIRSSVVKREIFYRVGEVFSPAKMKEIQKRLFDLNLFSNVTIHDLPSDSIDRRIPIQIHCTELKMRGIEINTGISQEQGIIEGAEPTSTINLRGNWFHRDIGRAGESLRITTQIATEISRNIGLPKILRANIDFAGPWTLRWKIPYGIRFLYVRTIELDQIKEQFGTEFSFRTLTSEKKWWRHNFTWKQIRLEGENIPQTDLGENFEHSISSAYYSDSRDNFIYPNQGEHVNIRGKYSFKFLGGTNHYARIDIAFSKYYPSIFHSQIAIRLKPGFAHAFENGIPLYEKFLLGGANSIRGIADGTIGADGDGNIRFLANTEWRFSLPFSFRCVLFADFGNVWSSFDQLQLTEMFGSAGLGIHYETPLGPFRIDWGKIIFSPDHKKYLPQIHLALQYAF